MTQFPNKHAIIGGQPVHDAITKIHDAIIGRQPVHDVIAKIHDAIIG